MVVDGRVSEARRLARDHTLELRQKLWAAVVEARASQATSAREQEANEFCSSWRDPAGDVGKKRPRAQPGAEGKSGTLGGYLPCQR